MMRTAFKRVITDHFNDENTFFLTGDLGFMALEAVRDSFGSRFVNCGIAEQNMVGVAAGLARDDFKVFVYSIAPFCYARPYEQIRNDLGFSNLSVVLVGNGGGYAYGHMGPTHHALEDCAAMLALPNVRVFVPAFNLDIVHVITKAFNEGGPAYVRLGREVCPEAAGTIEYAPWRRLTKGLKGCLAVLGPLAGLAWKVTELLPETERPSVWVATEMPLPSLPGDLLAETASGGIIVLEEHVPQGGLGMAISFLLAQVGCQPKAFIHRAALRYPSGKYGSQDFHRRECGLDEAGIIQAIQELRQRTHT